LCSDAAFRASRGSRPATYRWGGTRSGAAPSWRELICERGLAVGAVTPVAAARGPLALVPVGHARAGVEELDVPIAEAHVGATVVARVAVDLPVGVALRRADVRPADAVAVVEQAIAVGDDRCGRRLRDAGHLVAIGREPATARVGAPAVPHVLTVAIAQAEGPGRIAAVDHGVDRMVRDGAVVAVVGPAARAREELPVLAVRLELDEELDVGLRVGVVAPGVADGIAVVIVTGILHQSQADLLEVALAGRLSGLLTGFREDREQDGC